MGEAMYQSAFLSFKNCLNSVVIVCDQNRQNVNKDSPQVSHDNHSYERNLSN